MATRTETNPGDVAWAGDRTGAAGTNSLALSVENGFLLARLPLPARLERAPEVCVLFDGTHWAALPSMFADATQTILEVRCSVPPFAHQGRVAVTLRRHDDDAPLGRGTVDVGEGARNGYGLSARAVYACGVRAMFSVPWMQFDGAELVISGAHLPFEGDPSRVSVRFGAGVAAIFEYPLPSPEFGAHYWYWPNAQFSGFRLRIDLPACADGADPFTFAFVDTAQSVDEASHEWRDRGRVWIPRDLRAFTGFPADRSLLTRVQTWSEHKTVTFTGYNAFRAIESMLAHYGVRHSHGLRLLDWGCGHGRVARHFIQNWPMAEITGADIDAEAIAWSAGHLAGGDFVVAPLYPPLGLPAARFDVVIGLSVMTHLVARAQLEWIAEIHRLLKPNGIALISFGGHGAAAYASVHHTPDWWAAWLAHGFNDALRDGALQGKTLDDDYYRVTHQTPEHVRQTWARGFTVLGIERQAVGYQDIAVLRREG